MNTPRASADAHSYFRGMDAAYINKQLQSLQNRKWKSHEYKLLKKLFIRKLNTMPFDMLSLRIGSRVYRASINANSEELFSNVARLGINSKERTKHFGRANVPGKPVFYASTSPKTAVNEVTQWYLNDVEKFMNKGIIPYNVVNIDTGETTSFSYNFITVSCWEAQESIPLAPFIKESNLTKDNIIYNAYNSHKQAISKMHNNDNMKLSQLIVDFFTEQFIRKDINCEEDYMLSAMCTDFVHETSTLGMAGVERGITGVVYSSVADGFEGLNYAFSEQCIRSGKLKFVSAEKLIVHNDLSTPHGKMRFAETGKWYNTPGSLAIGRCESEKTGKLVWDVNELVVTYPS